jgi:hypothetical protein
VKTGEIKPAVTLVEGLIEKERQTIDEVRKGVLHLWAHGGRFSVPARSVFHGGHCCLDRFSNFFFLFFIPSIFQV